MKHLKLGVPITCVEDWVIHCKKLYGDNVEVKSLYSNNYFPDVDMIIFDGGADVNPALYGEDRSKYVTVINDERDKFEEIIFNHYLDKVPIAGICRGHQFINVMLGGSLYQDLPSIGYRHSHFHDVNVDISTKLPVVEFTNSYHHQAVRIPGDGLIITATHNDGICEGTESNDKLIRSVQWHPEYYEDFYNDVRILNYLFFMDIFDTEA